jgi:glucosamine-6-phosphate deaminase
MADVVIMDTSAQASELAAELISQTVVAHPRAVLGFATGSTPQGSYRALASRDLELSGVRGFALDEYIGLAPGHPESYRSVIDRDVVEPLGLRADAVRVPGDDGLGLDGAGARYERDIREAGGIDLQILGIGGNGHIGFNEPGSSLDSQTRIAVLTQSTRQANRRFFASMDDVPTHCITQGLGTIRNARRLVLLAFGEAKARAVALAVEGPVSASVPASVLQLHRDVTVIVDGAAASLLANADYYRDAWRRRDGWRN